MKKIIRLARLELSILFYSPIAWLVLIVFMIQAGITYTEQLYNQETQQQLERPLSSLTLVLFGGDNGMFKSIQDNLYLYIPLLTMGLFSRETSSGSIKLLLSSPITVAQIVLGKFLTIMIYALLLAFMMFGYASAAYLSVENFDLPIVLGGIFGLYLLILAYAAIGLFMSSLTNYQVVAAISTLAILAALNFIGEIGQQYDLIRDITYWLSMAGRTEKMVNGLIISRDVIYFLLFIMLFLILTMMKLAAGRQKRSFGVRVLRYGALLISVIAVGYITSLPALTGYLDTTRFKNRTLTEFSQSYTSRFTEPVTITAYTNVAHYTAGFGAPKNRIGDMGQFEKYQRFMPGLKMEYVAYYDEPLDFNDTTKTLVERAKRSSEALGFNFNKLLKPEEIRKMVDLSAEDRRFVRMVTYKGKSVPLRMFDDMFVYPFESEITAALKRLLDDPARVGFITGNEERSTDKYGDREYKAITKGLGVRSALINQGFVTQNIDLSKGEPIPDSLSVLVLADPAQTYPAEQQQKIIAYLQQGGNMLIAGEPGKEKHVNPILSALGVSMNAGTLQEKTENFEPELIQAKLTPEAAAEPLGMKFYDDAVVTLNGATALTSESGGEYRKIPLLINRSKEPVGFALTRNVGKREQRIIVMGDADFMSNVEMSRNTPNTVNVLFTTRAFRWFSNGEFPVSPSRPKGTDTKITISRSGVNQQKALFLGVLPLLIAVTGATTLVRRKRK
ncbi:Gldg family protein [Pedobacter faecalis]|uniref:Gldg family protein n=1 Tax=Pedobacter faecalis TaxID=3041495 RepID=UPI00254A1365|nr:Gldg family protein [Pedobacter sp. ELA7]